MSEQTKIIEIQGVKFELDLREAKRVEAYRVGDPVKVLIKEFSSYKSFPGVIVGFDEFKNLPTIVVAYLKISYSEAELCFAYYNDSDEAKEIEICPAPPEDLPIEKSHIVEMMDKKIAKAQATVMEHKQKKEYFLKCFGKYFRLEAPKKEATKNEA